jgi:hypothetical protein
MGLAVRQLKWFASWVQTVVRHVGFYLPQAPSLEKSCPLYERIGVNQSLVYQLSCQWHCWVAIIGKGYELKASKLEAYFKIRTHTQVRDYDLDRVQV